MNSFKVTDEGAGIIRVDAETRLMRKPMAEAICAEVDEIANRYGRFKILMNLGAISKGTPGAGLYTLRRMKEYDMTALALFRANGFMRGMATVVLGLARFSNFALFDDEAPARAWLERAGVEEPGPGRSGRLRRAGAPAAALVGGGLVSWLGLRRLRRLGRAGAQAAGRGRRSRRRGAGGRGPARTGHRRRLRPVASIPPAFRRQEHRQGFQQPPLPHRRSYASDRGFPEAP